MAESFTKGNMHVGKCAVVTFSDVVNAMEVREHMTKLWERFTKNMVSAKILFITGVHGLEDGELGEKSDGMAEMQHQVKISLLLDLNINTIFL